MDIISDWITQRHSMQLALIVPQRNLTRFLMVPWDSIIMFYCFDVDLTGTFRLSQAAIPSMIKNVSSATGVNGVIINIASTPGIAGHMAGAPDRIAKSGVIAITEHIALEYGEKNIRAYTLTLGNISAEAIFASMTMTERKKAATENSVKRWGDPREVATIAASVASEDFAFRTGNTIVIGRGAVML